MELSASGAPGASNSDPGQRAADDDDDLRAQQRNNALRLPVVLWDKRDLHLRLVGSRADRLGVQRRRPSRTRTTACRRRTSRSPRSTQRRRLSRSTRRSSHQSPHHAQFGHKQRAVIGAHDHSSDNRNPAVHLHVVLGNLIGLCIGFPNGFTGLSHTFTSIVSSTYYCVQETDSASPNSIVYTGTTSGHGQFWLVRVPDGHDLEPGEHVPDSGSPSRSTE